MLSTLGDMRRTSVALTMVLALVLADAAQAAPRPRLKSFTSCTQLKDYARAGALRTRGGAGVTPRAAPPLVDVVTTPVILPPRKESNTDTAAGAPAPVSGGTTIGGSTPEFSGTNTQEI